MKHPDFTTLPYAIQLATQLADKRLRLVLVESCTAGNVAAALAVIPGISSWLCGSLVVYRNDSKHQWLGVPQPLLDDPQIGPVSHQVTQLLSQRALAFTPEADMAAAVTGHIGPGSPAELDGHVFFSLAFRNYDQLQAQYAHTRLNSPAPVDVNDIGRRQKRLAEATCWVLENISKALT